MHQFLQYYMHPSSDAVRENGAKNGASHQILARWQLLQFWWLAPFSGEVAGDDAAAAERDGHLRGGIEHGFAGVGVPRDRPEYGEISESSR